MVSIVNGIQQCDLARSTRTAYGSKHFLLTRKKSALYALKIYITQDRMKNMKRYYMLYNKKSSMYINAIKKELWSSAFRLG